MKYEFIVHPGADPSKIRLAYRGASAVEVNGEGRLGVRTPAGGFDDDQPVGYQEINGDRVDVALSYLLEKGSAKAPVPGGEASETESYVYGFNVGDYDRTQPLVLDPAVLVYCGYLGGNRSESYYGAGMAVDGSGNIYITGDTSSTEATFPVVVGPDLTYSYGAITDGFVAKVNAAGTEISTATPPNELAVDLGTNGAWMYDSGAWTQLSAMNPEGMITANVDGNTDDELLLEFGYSGLWL